MQFGSLKPQAIRYNGWVKVYENKFVLTTATSVTITGGTVALAGNTDKEYKLSARIVNGFAGACNYLLRPNNDTGYNYGSQNLVAEDTVITAARTTSNSLIVTGCNAVNELAQANITLFAKSGYVRTAISETAQSILTTSVTTLVLDGLSWNETSANITSIVFLASQTNGIGSGSYIALYKKAFI